MFVGLVCGIMVEVCKCVCMVVFVGCCNLYWVFELGMIVYYCIFNKSVEVFCCCLVGECMVEIFDWIVGDYVFGEWGWLG